MNNTPLRYPGGKSIMTEFFERVITFNKFENQELVYAEPYCGGAGAAINLLLSDNVQSIRINDASIGIYSFWHAVLNEGDRFIDHIINTDVNLNEWQHQRKIFKDSKLPSFELGFATFYLSRTNRSGILSAGPMGGQDENNQKQANYKIDCRFNKLDLISRVRKIIAKRNNIYVTNLDAFDFLHSVVDKTTLVYLDPPYYEQGKALYLNYYRHDDHLRLLTYLKYKAAFNWILSYDNVPPILSLYLDFPLYQFDLSYSAQDVKRGSELLTHSAGLRFPNPLNVQKRRGSISIFQMT